MQFLAPINIITYFTNPFTNLNYGNILCLSFLKQNIGHATPFVTKVTKPCRVHCIVY